MAKLAKKRADPQACAIGKQQSGQRKHKTAAQGRNRAGESKRYPWQNEQGFVSLWEAGGGGEQYLIGRSWL